MEAGKIAPTAVNNQPQKIYVLKSEAAREKMKSLSRCTYGAPILLLVCYDDTIVWHNHLREGYNSGEVDASIVLTHMMLRAWELGIGSCWVGMFNDKEVQAGFELPEHIHPVALMPIGYPAEGAKPSERHLAYRDMTEMVTEL